MGGGGGQEGQNLQSTKKKKKHIHRVANPTLTYALHHGAYRLRPD
jgi:hypothetical protein